MSDVLREQISAFMDGELPAEECELLIRRLAASSELADCWRTYHLVGDALRGELAAGGAMELAPRVGLALSGDRPAHWKLRRAATMAAGVAVIGLAGLVGALVSNRVGGGKVYAPGGGSPDAVTQPAQINWSQTPTSVRAELNQYLLMHDLYGAGPAAPANGVGGGVTTTSAASVVTGSGTGPDPRQ